MRMAGTLCPLTVPKCTAAGERGVPSRADPEMLAVQHPGKPVCSCEDCGLGARQSGNLLRLQLAARSAEAAFSDTPAGTRGGFRFAP